MGSGVITEQRVVDGRGRDYYCYITTSKNDGGLAILASELDEGR